MSYKPEQIDKGPLRNYIGQKEKKFSKKQLHRKVRRQLKDFDIEPSYTSYNGWRV